MAEAGQTMTVTLKPSRLSTYFNVYEPGRAPGDEALAVSEMTGPMRRGHHSTKMCSFWTNIQSVRKLTSVR
jgi:hypothetical protein